MKVLRIDRQSGTWPCEAQEAIGQDVICPLPVEMIADSAVNRNDRPVFVPDFAISGGWTLDILPVIHIGHQGKSIASRFAHRYVSGLSLAAQLHPASGSRFLPLYGAIDTAFTLGPALPLTIRPEHQPDNDTNWLRRILILTGLRLIARRLKSLSTTLRSPGASTPSNLSAAN